MAQNLNFMPIDKAIREGRLPEARILLRPLVTAKRTIKRLQDLRTLAELCRRAGWQQAAVQILHPAIRPTGRTKWTVGPAELAEYAASLSFIGGSTEALQILQSLDVSREPRTLLFQAFSHFSRWDYPAALPLLEEYVVIESLTSYERQVGRINLLSALVNTGQFDKTLTLADQLIAEVPPGSLLWTNALEIKAQASLFSADFASAKECFDLMAKAPHMTGIAYQLLIDKWKIFAEIRSAGVSKKRANDFEKIIKLARDQQRWETVRDASFLKAWVTADERQARKIFFGTPYQEFRKRLIERANFNFKVEENYNWILQSGPNAEVLDLTTTPHFLKGNGLPFRLLKILTSDFYRPQTLASIAAELFPSDHYHPIHSLNKVNQVLVRLRKILRTEKSALEIRWRTGRLSLHSAVAFQVRVPHPDRIVDEWGPVFQSTEWLTFAELESRLGIPRRSLQRKLQQAATHGTLKVRGATRSRSYARTEKSE